jgi:23S rRNA pseudouridine2457 synthase
MPLLLLHKPYQVLTRFSPSDGRKTLADVVKAPGLHPAGRLDFDSEGLLLLTDDGVLQARITDPRHHLAKTYWVQVEGEPSDEALAHLRRGVLLPDGLTRPAEATRLPTDFEIWPRDPPIRVRAHIPTRWIALTIREGRNRQVRRMTAAVGFPTLRLVRSAIGPFSIEGLAPGSTRVISPAETQAFKESLALPRSPPPRRVSRYASPPRGPARN